MNPGLLTPLSVMKQGAEILKSLGHAHRLQMVQMLLAGRYTVGELAKACGIPSHMASEHLRLLQQYGLLTKEKNSRSVYYRVADPFVQDIMMVIETWFSGMARAGCCSESIG